MAPRPCLHCGEPTRSMTGYCRRTKACKHGYNAEWHKGAGMPGYIPPWDRQDPEHLPPE